VLVTVGQLEALQERFYAITTVHRHRMELLERLLVRSNEGASAGQAAPLTGP
jgi:LysR family transcriptional activator of nhaA